MTKNDPTCYYHPDRNAIAHCEKCNRMVCLECKRIYRRSYYSGTSHHRHRYVERYEYCPICMHTQKEKNIKGGSLSLICFAIVAFIMFAIFFMSADDMTNNSGFGGSALDSFFDGPKLIFGLIIGGMMLCGITKLIFVDPKTKAENERQKQNFIKKVGLNQNYDRILLNSPQKEITMPKYQDTVVERSYFYCRQCGEKLTKKIRFCPACGDTTADELSQMK